MSCIVVYLVCVIQNKPIAACTRGVFRGQQVFVTNQKNILFTEVSNCEPLRRGRPQSGPGLYRLNSQTADVHLMVGSLHRSNTIIEKA